MPYRSRRILFVLFTVSGFTGLIYESIWTHYLKLFLGHAAYAQALVLAIFMGGLAVGSWICSRRSAKWRRLLLGYALAEGALGVSAILFHPVFSFAIDLAYTAVLPELGSPGSASLFKWALSAILILPQTILLGMTFPLMVAAFLRSFPDAPGRSIALLYFTNSIGAAVGVLVSGFVLVGLLGLPGTMAVAGSTNVVLAAVVWRLARRGVVPSSAPRASQGTAPDGGSSSWYRSLLFVSGATGLASFVYEMGWIRMLSLVLGSSTHAFELMLSAFIFGLAFGGLWIHRRIDALSDPRRTLALVQVAMGLLALGTLPLYGESFDVMRRLVTGLPKSDAGYLLFNLGSNAIALVIMVPATFCAGMTLPLITTSLIRNGRGEASIGAVYAVNTVGAIAGVFLAIHVGIPQLGLKGLMVAGASLDLSLGLYLAWRLAKSDGRRSLPLALTMAATAAVLAAALLVRFEPYLMASGVYRTGVVLSTDKHRLLFHRDGKTATVSVDEHGVRRRSIRTNGKVDSEIILGAPAGDAPDEATTILLAALPLSHHRLPRTAAIIGLGTGLTTHTLLCSPDIERVDTIEIEREMVEAARLFAQRVGSVYTDPRSRIHLDDAKSFFSVNQGRYDIIISEPSNPWVSGVAGLFSEEFYEMVARHLKDDGIFVQWVQMYEIDEELVASVLKALSATFHDYQLYAPNFEDMLIVARRTGVLPPSSYAPLTAPRLAAELERVGIKNARDLDLRRIGDRKMLQGVFDAYSVRPNSDYYPVLDEGAAKARFMQAGAHAFLSPSLESLPFVDMLAGRAEAADSTPVTMYAPNPRANLTRIALSVRDYLLWGHFDPACDASMFGSKEWVPGTKQTYLEAKESAAQLERLFFSAWPPDDPNRRIYLFNAAKSIFPYLSPAESASIWRRLESGPGAAALSAIESDYVALFKAIGNRDARAMNGAAKRLLAEEQDMTPARGRYVLAAAMLGSVAMGDLDEARQLWSRHRDSLFTTGEPGILFRLLLTQAAPPRAAALSPTAGTDGGTPRYSTAPWQH